MVQEISKEDLSKLLADGELEWETPLIVQKRKREEAFIFEKASLVGTSCFIYYGAKVVHGEIELKIPTRMTTVRGLICRVLGAGYDTFKKFSESNLSAERTDRFDHLRMDILKIAPRKTTRTQAKNSCERLFQEIPALKRVRKEDLVELIQALRKLPLTKREMKRIFTFIANPQGNVILNDPTIFDNMKEFMCIKEVLES